MKEFADITDTSEKQVYSAADTEIKQKERQQGGNVSRALGPSLIKET